MKKFPFITGIAFVACLSFAIVSSSDANARVSIRANGSCGKGCTSYAIAISGPIDQGTRAQFLAAANDPRIKATLHRFSSTIILDSPGGDVLQAIEIGRVVRQAGFMTFVGPTEECSSACVFILAAGIIRTADYGRVGIHRPHFDETYFASLSMDEARAKYEQMTKSVRQYLSEMGMSDALYEDVMKISSDDVNYLSPAQMTDYGLIGRDAAWSEYNRAQAIKREGVEQYTVNDIWFHLLASCMNKFGPGPACDRDALAEFQSRLDACTNDTPNRVACARAVAERMKPLYATP